MSLRSVMLSLCLVTLAATVLQPRRAEAESIIQQPYHGPRRDIELNFHGIVGYGFGYYGDYAYGGCGPVGGCYNNYYSDYSLGVGFQMLFPVVQNGFIPKLNNAFYVGFFTEFMAIPYYYASYRPIFSMAIGPMVQWRFFLFREFEVFNNIGFGIWPWFDGLNSATEVRVWPVFEFGGNWRFAKHVALTFSFGYPSIKAGISIGF